MLVVDRRDDQTTYAPGANRAEVQAELERHLVDHDVLDSTTPALPVQVAVERPDDTRESGQGVACVTETPGPEALLKILLERVWGVSNNGSK
jgi:hypothetical protein